MKSIFLTIAVFAVLVFSQSVSGQADAPKTNWKIIVKDNSAPKKNGGKMEKMSKTKDSKPSENADEKSPLPVSAEKKDFAGKPAEVFTTNEISATTGKNNSVEKPQTADAPPSKTTPKKVSEWEKNWSVLAKFSASFDTNLEHDPVGEKAFGFVPSITSGYQMRSSRHRLRFIYSFAAPRYTIDTDLTRVGNYFAAAYRYSIGRWSFETDGEISLKGTNEDRETNDQYILTETINYRFDGKTRLGIYGAYRVRRFSAEDADRNAVNPMLGLKFSRALSEKIEWNFGYRYDENRAVSPRQNYIRTTYKTGFDIELTKNDALDAEISYRPRRYKNRLVEIGDAEVLRRDKKWSFDAVWTHNFSPRWGFEAGYQFEKQNSNDADKIFRNHQIVFSVFYHWGNGDVIKP